MRRTSSKLLAEWEAFWELEPFGDEWRQAGTVAAAAVSPHVEKGTHVSADDFIPKVKEPQEQKEQISGEDILAMFRPLATKKHGNNRLA